MSDLLAAGNLYLDRYVSGVRVGERGPLNALKFAITLPKSETVTRKSYLRDSFGSTLSTVVLASGSGTVSIELGDADPDVLAYALLGTVGDVNANSGTATSEAVTAAHDLYRKLAHRAVSSVVVKDSTDTTTYVNLVDYTVDATSGMVKALSSGSIVDGATLHVSYSYAALSSRQILAAQSNEVRAHLRLDGTNLVNQKKMALVIPEAALIPKGDISLIGDKMMTYTLEGELVLRTGESAPFTYHEID